MTALAPLGVFIRRAQRARAIRRDLGLAGPSRRSVVAMVCGLAAVPGLLSVAATQPVLDRSRAASERTDAQLFVAMDISRSMLASTGPRDPTRFDRARSIAVKLRDEQAALPIGIASLTTVMLPHLFPTTDRRVFMATLTDAITVASVWTGLGGTVSTSLDAIEAAPTLNYFPPDIKKRVLVVLTDGESLPVERDLSAAFRRRPRIETIFVVVRGARERVYVSGVPEAGYAADEAAEEKVRRVASIVGGRVLREREAGELSGMVGDLVGSGPTAAREHEGDRRALMPYFALLSLVPLGLVILRRNVVTAVPAPWSRRRSEAAQSEAWDEHGAGRVL